MQRLCCEHFPQMHRQTPAVPAQQRHVVMFPSPARPQITPLLRKMIHTKCPARSREGRRRGESGRRQPAKPSLIRLLISHVPIEAVNKMDVLSPVLRSRSIRLPFCPSSVRHLPQSGCPPSPASLWGGVKGVLTFSPIPGDVSKQHVLCLARAGGHVDVAWPRLQVCSRLSLPPPPPHTADAHEDPGHAGAFPGSTR